MSAACCEGVRPFSQRAARLRCVDCSRMTRYKNSAIISLGIAPKVSPFRNLRSMYLCWCERWGLRFPLTMNVNDRRSTWTLNISDPEEQLVHLHKHIPINLHTSAQNFQFMGIFRLPSKTLAQSTVSWAVELSADLQHDLGKLDNKEENIQQSGLDRYHLTNQRSAAKKAILVSFLNPAIGLKFNRHHVASTL